MNNLLIYLLKSTICLSLMYLLFRTVMRKETFFTLNRLILLSIVIFSTVIPLLTVPAIIESPIKWDMMPVLTTSDLKTDPFSTLDPVNISDLPLSTQSVPERSIKMFDLSIQQLLGYAYLLGLFATMMFLLTGLITIFKLFYQARLIKIDGHNLLLIEQEIPAFSFYRFVVLSQKDYNEYRTTLLTHEQAHIKLNHFYDLAIVGVAKIFHWFNPFIYLLINDLKEIHEFQADDYTLTKGIDATQYQLLIIQKGVGSKRFALANSFNYCQIKKRIAMMNKQKTRKAWNWKVATFLPMLALLLMAFGKSGEKPTETKMTANLIIQKQQEIQPVKEGITNDQLTEYLASDQTKIDTKGQVLNSNGQPISGASVLLKGSTIGTITDQEGKFELNWIPSDAELLIFHTGYNNKFMKVTDKTMRIIMEEGKFAPPPPPAKDGKLSNGSGNLSKIDTKGQVLNNEGLPLPEASVLLLGSTYGTITDQEGKFELKGIPSDGELAVTSLGFSPKVLKASGQPMKIKMETETIANDKVSANGKKIPPPPPPLILTKKYASLLDRTNPPSIFLDGVQIERKAMDHVDVNKIQNVKVLLDQEATDKYGDQGKNGVIQITMKSAKGKTLVK